MKFSDNSHNLRIELDTKQCELSGEQIEKLEEGLHSLRNLAAKLPVSDLYITIYHYPHTGEYQVKTALVLPKKTLFSKSHDSNYYPAYEKCVRNLVQQLTAFDEKQQLTEPLHFNVEPSLPPDAEAIERSVVEGDYAAFRVATYPYEESLRKRVGRWLGRYPDIQDKIGTDLAIADIVEGVFLSAFEDYNDWPREKRFGDWLESEIDVELHNLIDHPEEEKQSISFAQTLQELARERQYNS